VKELMAGRRIEPQSFEWFKATQKDMLRVTGGVIGWVDHQVPLVRIPPLKFTEAKRTRARAMLKAGKLRKKAIAEKLGISDTRLYMFIRDGER
jgi:hypothetical protein